jgi:hypothetical protein
VQILGLQDQLEMHKRSWEEAETRCRQAEELLQAERRGIEDILGGRAQCELKIAEVRRRRHAPS